MEIGSPGAGACAGWGRPARRWREIGLTLAVGLLSAGWTAAQNMPPPEGERPPQPAAPDPAGGISAPPAPSSPAPGTPPREIRRPAGGGSGLRVPQLQETRVEPFNGFATGNLFRHGPLGFMDLSLGLAAGSGAMLNNLALNGGVSFKPWLRAHLTAVARTGNWSPAPAHLIQEGYLEAAGRTRFAGDPLRIGLRFGKVQNVVMDPTPLSIFDETPFWTGNRLSEVPAYQQFVPYVDWQSRYGLGFHAMASYGAFGSNAGVSPVNGYLRLRAQNARGYIMEQRYGWLTSRSVLTMADFPGHPSFGSAIYLGRQWKSGVGLGIAIEQTLDEPYRIGARVNLPTNGASQAFGNFLGRFRTSTPSVSAQLPLGRLSLGEQKSAPPPGGQLVGTVRAQRIYRATSAVGPGQYPVNDEYVLSRQGQTRGRGLVRVVAEGPRSLTGFAGLASPDGPASRYNNEYVQDVVYSYYRIVPFSDTWLEGRVYDKENPSRAIQNLTVRLKGPGDDQAVTPQNGGFRVQHRVPSGKRQNVTLVASAPGYVEEILETRVAPGGTQVVEIPLRPLRASVVGRLIDADTGRPIPEVEALLTQEGRQPVVVLTGVNGEFRLPAVAPGRYVFATHAPRYYDERQELAIDPGQAQRVEVRLRPRPAALAGRLLDGGQPVAGARITLTGADGNAREMLTLQDGSFGITGLASGQYTLRLTTASGEKREMKVNLTAGEITAVDFKLK
jgi:hypothetical protein